MTKEQLAKAEEALNAIIDQIVDLDRLDIYPRGLPADVSKALRVLRDKRDAIHDELALINQ